MVIGPRILDRSAHSAVSRDNEKAKAPGLLHGCKRSKSVKPGGLRATGCRRDTHSTMHDQAAIGPQAFDQSDWIGETVVCSQMHRESLERRRLLPHGKLQINHNRRIEPLASVVRPASSNDGSINNASLPSKCLTWVTDEPWDIRARILEELSSTALVRRIYCG